MKIDNEEYLVGMGIDITERMRAEESLKERQREIEELNATLERRLQEELEKSRQKDVIMMHQSRLAAMGEMIGLIAHQWRQPLNALNLLLFNIKDFFEEKKLTETTIENFIDNGVKMIMKMSTTIDDFRNFFKPCREQEEFSINKIIKDTLSLVAASFKYNNISVIVNEMEEIIGVGFPNEYSQVILNILNNAKDAIVNKGIAGEIIIDVFYENKFAVVKIKDNGEGIPKDILNKIFEPYFTTRSGEEGTGLGLYLSKVIIEEHMNGYINVQNTDDGTEFKITTPITHGNLMDKGLSI